MFMTDRLKNFVANLILYILSLIDWKSNILCLRLSTIFLSTVPSSFLPFSFPLYNTVWNFVSLISFPCHFVSCYLLLQLSRFYISLILPIRSIVLTFKVPKESSIFRRLSRCLYICSFCLWRIRNNNFSGNGLLTQTPFLEDHFSFPQPWSCFPHGLIIQSSTRLLRFSRIHPCSLLLRSWRWE